MSGTFTAQSLDNGFVSNSQAAIYTVPASTVLYLNSLSLFCDTATPQTVQLYLKKSGGTARKWQRYVFSEQYDHADAAEGSRITLSAGDTIEAVTTTASVVAYFITGVLET